MSARTEWVDYAKGIGILLVVYGHVARGVHAAGLPIDAAMFKLVDSTIYSFHMPLFFFLSGLYFLASLERHGAIGTVAAKLRTVAWPYLVWSLLQGVVELLLSRFTNGSVTLAEVASLLWQPRAQFWFLYALFFIALLAIPVYRWLPSRWQPAVPAFACLAYLFAELLPGGVPLNFVIHNAPYFALGAWFGKHCVGGEREHAARDWLLPAALIAIAVMLQWLFHGTLELTYASGPRWLRLLLALVSVAAMVALCRWLARYRLDWLAALGRASLAIYVMHILAGSGTRIVLQKLFGVETAGLHLLIGSLSGILLPLLALQVIHNLRLGFLLAWPRSRIGNRG